MNLAALLGGQLLMLAAQLAYVSAFREAFERQTSTLKARPWLCLAAGILAAAAWTTLGRAVYRSSMATQRPWLLELTTAPLFLASAAGGAVCLSVIVARALGWDLRRRPYPCVALGQILGFAAGLLPKLAMPVVALYVCGGIGAVLVAEFSESDDDAARLGVPGLASLVILTAVITLGIAGRR